MIIDYSKWKVRRWCRLEDFRLVKKWASSQSVERGADDTAYPDTGYIISYKNTDLAIVFADLVYTCGKSYLHSFLSDPEQNPFTIARGIPILFEYVIDELKANDYGLIEIYLENQKLSKYCQKVLGFKSVGAIERAFKVL